jgi:AcrR family transcriptional regulator
MSERKREILEAACRVIGRRGVRGLRVEEIAREADVSVALIYYYFDGRANLLQRVLEYVNDRAGIYTEREPLAGSLVRERVEDVLLREIDDDPTVVENVTVWSELIASALFEPHLRDAVRRSSERWTNSVAEMIREGQREGTIPDGVIAGDVAERLTALVDGLSSRWLIGTMTAEMARTLLQTAIAQELGVPARESGAASP